MNIFRQIIKINSAVAYAGTLFTLSACTFLPTTGPSAEAVRQEAKFAKQVHFVEVNPNIADIIATSYRHEVQIRAAHTVVELERLQKPVSVQMLPGDVVNVTLWTQPMLAGLSGNTNSQSSVINKTDLGNYTIDNAGDLVLPYAGQVPVPRMTVPEADGRIASRFAALGQFEQAQVSIAIVKNRRQHIVVTGAANHPLIVDWQTGGVTLSDAITKAGGYKIFTATKNHDLTTNEVVIQRGVQRFSLPMAAAIESNVPLYPGDVVILEHKTKVRVQCLGGGWSSNTLQSFDYTPTLSAVVAAGGGLSAATAQGKAVYVLSSDHDKIYQFPWDTLAGLQAAQSFPVENGDIVYIATSPSATFQQVVNILFDAAYPIATAHAVL